MSREKARKARAGRDTPAANLHLLVSPFSSSPYLLLMWSISRGKGEWGGEGAVPLDGHAWLQLQLQLPKVNRRHCTRHAARRRKERDMADHFWLKCAARNATWPRYSPSQVRMSLVILHCPGAAAVTQHSNMQEGEGGTRGWSTFAVVRAACVRSVKVVSGQWSVVNYGRTDGQGRCAAASPSPRLRLCISPSPSPSPSPSHPILPSKGALLVYWQDLVGWHRPSAHDSTAQFLTPLTRLSRVLPVALGSLPGRHACLGGPVPAPTHTTYTLDYHTTLYVQQICAANRHVQSRICKSGKLYQALPSSTKLDWWPSGLTSRPRKS